MDRLAPGRASANGDAGGNPPGFEDGVARPTVKYAVLPACCIILTGAGFWGPEKRGRHPMPQYTKPLSY